jgi:hypothetical protein
VIPEEEWTKNQREFVGSEFDTPKGGVLTVTGVSKRKTGSHARFTCRCSICSKDIELFPEDFTATKGALSQGSFPCMCTKTDTLTDRQELLLVNRKLLVKTPQIKAVGIRKRGVEKVFTLTCDICSKDPDLWPDDFTISRGNLLSGRVPCGCAKEQGVYTDEQDLLLTNRMLSEKGSTLTAQETFRVKNKSNRCFILTCSVCSKDTELFPYGSISSTKGQLKIGHKPCGCPSTPRWNEDQNKIRVIRKSKENGYIFHGWSEGYHGKDTKLLLENPETGNTWRTTSMHHYLTGGGDPSERSGGGFDRTKSATIYVNKFYNGNEPLVIKYGITNKDVKDRRGNQERYSGLRGETVYTYSSSCGEVIENLEKVLGGIIKVDRVNKSLLPDGYTEAVHYKPFVECFIVNYLEMLTKNLSQ